METKTSSVKRAIPNLLSGFRLLAAPLLLWIAWSGRPNLFLTVLVVSFLTDLFDGLLARRFGTQSELGARLDSWGDFVIYVALPMGAWRLWPELVRHEATYVFLILGAYLLPALVGFAKFRCLTSYHTWSAKIAGAITCVSVLLGLFFGITWLFRAAAFLQLLVAAESIAITLRLREPKSNVASVAHTRAFVEREKSDG